jgi:hypothetical protein
MLDKKKNLSNEGMKRLVEPSTFWKRQMSKTPY